MAQDEKQATFGDVIVAVHKGATQDSDDGTVEIVGMVLDSMMAGQAHTQDMLHAFYEDARDERDIVRDRIQRILAYAPRLGPAREYEQILSYIERATYVSHEALEAYRASPEHSRDLSLRLPAEWSMELAW